MNEQQYTEQRTTTTTVAAKNAPANLAQESTDTLFGWTEGGSRVSYTAGKTISLGDFQFARVGVTIETEYLRDDDMTAAFDTVKAASKEIVEQESASLKSEDRDVQDVYMGHFKKYRVTIEYGLTLKTGKFDSAKVDISTTRYTTFEFFGATVKSMRDQLAQRVMAESREIKGG